MNIAQPFSGGQPLAQVKLFADSLEVSFPDGSVYAENFHSPAEAFEILRSLLDFETGESLGSAA